MAISFYFETNTKLTNRRLLKHFLKDMLESEKGNVSNIVFIFCSDSFLLDINIRHLKHNYYTDIITFEFDSGRTGMTDGEIYISVERVLENSKKFKTIFEEELYRVIIHGVLHLCGYKDKKPPEKMLMRKKEDFYIKNYRKYVPRET